MYEVKCGIYRILNNVNGKSYIGQSIDIYKRWKEHVLNAKSNRLNYALYSAMNKYGIDNFSFSILEECEPHKLSDKEIYYIELFRTYVDFEDSNGYNMTLGGDGNKCYGKTVYQYDLFGNYMTEYPSIAEASRAISVDISQISGCCLGKHRSAGNYQFSFDKKESLDFYNKYDTFGIDQYSHNAEYITTFSSCAEASYKTNTPKYLIYCCCNKNSAIGGDYIWRKHGDAPPEPYIYYNGEKRVCQYTLDGIFLKEYNSIAEAARSLGVKNGGNICACLKHKRNKAYGYIWKYAS